MKLIGKQIVVELPEKKENKKITLKDFPFMNQMSLDQLEEFQKEYDLEVKFHNSALTEVAKMNTAWEVDVKELSNLVYSNFLTFARHTVIDEGSACIVINPIAQAPKIAQALASNPSAWLKRKE